MNLLDKSAYLGVKYFGTANPSTAPSTAYRPKDKYANTTTGEIFTCYANESYGVSWAGTQGTILDADILNSANANLVVMYTMDSISGATLVDESPNSKNGVITAATTTAGKIGNSIQLGNGKYVTLPVDVFGSGSTGAFSFFYKFGSGDSGVINRILYHNEGPVPRNIGIIKDASNQIRATVNATSVFHITSSVLNADTWYHIVFEQDGTRHRLYVDAVDDTTGAGTTEWFANLPGGTQWINLGRYWDGNTQLTEGTDFELDHFRYFNRSLTPNEISTLYAEGL